MILNPCSPLAIAMSVDYLNGRTSHTEMITLLKRDTRRYAKRQFTWFRNDKDMIWVDPHDLEQASQLVAEFMGEQWKG